eukprot:TRINITY_DN8035_c0_g1_i7.p1 TRINITY_DN8035_c0_g1~~TRINITY_DN8035_c0_g1_i7.p1  ORF type:complete len:621 (+),score=135.75 TRINITY_DN8035_c0_g1_i7:74-1936(+)
MCIRDSSFSTPIDQILSNPLVQTLTKSTPSQLSNLKQYSGFGIGELGDYAACRATNDSYHVGVYLGHYFFAAWLGLCVPKEVTIDLLYSQQPFLAKMVSEWSGVPLKDSEVAFADTRKTNEEARKSKLGYYLVWGGLGALVVLSVVASVADCSVEQENGVMKVLRCFSLVRNVKSLFNTRNKLDENLDIFNGIRVVCMIWIIWAHTYDFGSQGPIKNMFDYKQDVKFGYIFALVINGTLSVDIFFFISGFFATLSLSKIFQNPKNRSVKTIVLSYFFRYMRLAPLLLVCILYRLYIEPRLKDSPFHIKLRYDEDRCEKTWHHALFCINNLTATFADMCIDWTWYLIVDMQMYLVCPWLVLAFATSYNIGFVVLGLSYVLSVFVQVVSIYYYEMNYYTAGYSDYYNIRAPQRILPYLMGIAYCILYKEHAKTKDFYKPLRCIRDFFYSKEWPKYVIYIVCPPIMYEMIFIRNYFDNHQQDVTNAIFCVHEIFNRVIFIFCLMLVLYPSLIGKGQPIKSFLGLPIFSPIAKITYGAYVFHPFHYISYYWYSMRGYHFTHTMYFKNFVVTFTTAYLLSLVMTPLVESPVNLLIRNFLEGTRSGSKLTPIKGEEEASEKKDKVN